MPKEAVVIGVLLLMLGAVLIVMNRVDEPSRSPAAQVQAERLVESAPASAKGDSNKSTAQQEQSEAAFVLISGIDKLPGAQPNYSDEIRARYPDRFKESLPIGGND